MNIRILSVLIITFLIVGGFAFSQSDINFFVIVDGGSEPSVPVNPPSGGGGGSVLGDINTVEESFDDNNEDDNIKEDIIEEKNFSKSCLFEDEDYISRGPFVDTIGHWGYPYIEIMRISCLHRGRHAARGEWIYEPEGNVTIAELLKTLVKIMGIEFEDLNIVSEDIDYLGNIIFEDVKKDHRFAHYAEYAYEKGLVNIYAYMKNNKRYIQPDKNVTRNQAIYSMMKAYNIINKDKVNINIDGNSVMGDLIGKNNMFYYSIREAEVLGFIHGVPMEDGGFQFQGDRYITRAEFAKIISVPFGEQLFDVENMIRATRIYDLILVSLTRTNSNKKAFFDKIVEKMYLLDNDIFLETFKMEKRLFLSSLKNIFHMEFDR